MKSGIVPANQLPRHEAARRAITEARKLQGSWLAFAKMLTRNSNVKLELHANETACTDGKTIWVRVPIELADMGEHERTLCGKRDEDLILKCNRCAILEDVDITIIHEVSHIAFNTFQQTSAYEVSRILENAIKVECEGRPDSKRAQAIAKRIQNASGENTSDYLNLAGLVSPFLPLLINACEDIRVNSRMRSVRRGTKIMFDAQTNRVFNHGVKMFDGSIMLWREAPPNSQALIGVYCMTGELSIRGKLADDIVDKLESSPALADICERMRNTESIHEIYKLSFPLLEELRNLGFCRLPDEPEDEPPEESSGPGEESEDGDPSPESDMGGESSSDDRASNEEQDSEGNTDEDVGVIGESSDRGSSRGGDDSGDTAGDFTGDVESSAGDGSSDSETTESSQPPEDASEGSRSGDTRDVPNSEGNSEGGSPDEDDAEAGQPQGEGQTSAEHGDEQGDQESKSSNQESGNQGRSDSDSDQTEDGPVADDETAHQPVQAGAGSTDEASVATDGQDDQGTAEIVGKDSGLPDLEKEGTPEDVEILMQIFGRHEPQHATPSERHEQHMNQEAIELALAQMDFFDQPSLNISGVSIEEHDTTGMWKSNYFNKKLGRQPIPVSEGILSASLQRMRLAFTQNRRAKKSRNLYTGRIDGGSLARKIPTKDERIFQRKVEPGKRDYFVLIGLDCSGSTSSHIDGGYERFDMMKAAVSAKAELCHRLGIKFAVYAHSGSGSQVVMFAIKTDKEPWGKAQKEALAQLAPYSANLDGHTLEFYRKVAQRRTETDKIILYYTDGAMPLANREEETIILKREIKMCERLGIHLVGVGVNTDSPKQHGLDTIRLDTVSDIPKVVVELRKRLVS